MVYVDVFVAGVGKWYEFKCEETALIRDIIKENPNNFRVFGPDETMSNRLSHIFEADNRCWYLTKKKEEFKPIDEKDIWATKIKRPIENRIIKKYLKQEEQRRN